MEMPSAPDIYVNSEVDAATLEINAFESLVGAHGGLGGWQDRGLLIAPSQLLDAPSPRSAGPSSCTDRSSSMLVRLGQRSQLSLRHEVAHP